MTNPPKTTAADDARKPVREQRLIAIRDWKEPWYSTGVHIPADEMATIASELIVARSKVSDLEAQLRTAIDAARVMSGRLDQYCADEEQLQAQLRQERGAHAKAEQQEDHAMESAPMSQAKPVPKRWRSQWHRGQANHVAIGGCTLRTLIEELGTAEAGSSQLADDCAVQAQEIFDLRAQVTGLQTTLAKVVADKAAICSDKAQLQTTVGQLRDALLKIAELHRTSTWLNDLERAGPIADAALATCPAPAKEGTGGGTV